MQIETTTQLDRVRRDEATAARIVVPVAVVREPGFLTELLPLKLTWILSLSLPVFYSNPLGFSLLENTSF